MKKAKYTDKFSTSSYQKENERPFEKSSRQVRRERERELQKFSIKMTALTSREWWDAIKLEDKESIRRDYYSNLRTPGFTLDNWIGEVKKKWKPEPVKYRDMVIEILLDGDN